MDSRCVDCATAIKLGRNIPGPHHLPSTEPTCSLQATEVRGRMKWMEELHCTASLQLPSSSNQHPTTAGGLALCRICTALLMPNNPIFPIFFHTTQFGPHTLPTAISHPRQQLWEPLRIAFRPGMTSTR